MGFERPVPEGYLPTFGLSYTAYAKSKANQCELE